MLEVATVTGNAWPSPSRISDVDVERIARRVVELLREAKTP